MCCGFTDIADGLAARALHQESAFGAKLDSIADFVFAVSVAIVVIINIDIPVWLWVCISGTALLRFISCGIAFFKYRTFASPHTWANKITGALIFTSPIFCRVCGLTITGVVLCAAAFYSSLEELVIAVKFSRPNRDCKSAFIR